MRSAALLSIGALARASDIPVETLRTWERRYGFPRPLPRKGSGHRRYDPALVEQLRLIRSLLSLGHRPSDVVALSKPELEELLGLTQPEEAVGEASPWTVAPSSPPRRGVVEAEGYRGPLPRPLPPIEPRLDEPAPPSSASSLSRDGFLARWIELTRRLDGDGLERELHRAWDELGAMVFLEQRCGPFVVAVGDAWAKGDLTVMHEHHASERVRDFLVGKWRQLSKGARGPRVVVATLTNELHTLGAHMANVVLSLARIDVVFLGSSTPADEIDAAVRQQGAAGVVVSVSSAMPERVALDDLGRLRTLLPSNVRVAGGGEGMPEAQGVESLEDFASLRAWARALSD